MPERHISVTEAARGFSDLVSRVRYRGESATLVKNGTCVARIIPMDERPLPPPDAAALADLLPDPRHMAPADRDRLALRLAAIRAGFSARGED